jgi:hypothetical protein
MGKTQVTLACVFDPKTMSLTYDPGATIAAREMWR